MATLGDQRLPESFWAKVKLTESGCWEWTGAVATNGYARLSLMPWGKARTAHRIAYEVLAGPIPTGLDLDHLCRVRWCVNPAHLEPVTRKENLRRGDHNNRRRTHCRNGHEYTPENTVRPRPGARTCRICGLASRARYRERQRAA